MRAPRWLLGAAMLFWGWQTEWLWLGALAALLLESPHWASSRWDLTQADLDRVWNLCVALFLGATVYVFLSGDNLTAVGELLKDNSASSRLATLNQSKRNFFQLLQWLPLMFLPIALAQVYSGQDRFALSTFSWWLRRRRADRGLALRYPAGLNVSYPYFACCLFSASAANQRSWWFTAALAGLCAWSLWPHRSESFRAHGWIGSLVLALGLGFGVQLGLLEMQKLIQRLDEVLLARWGTSRNADPKENQTRLGSIGRLKLSGRLVMRVTPATPAPPALLRETSYSLFHTPYWTASKRDFERVTPELNQSSWILQPSREKPASARIAGYMPGGNGILALPGGVDRLEQLPASGLATNLFGSVRVEDGPGFVEFDASYQPHSTIDSPPTVEDTGIPPAELDTVTGVARSLNLEGLSPELAVRTLEDFFQTNFTYSTWQGFAHRGRAERTPLARFLLENRSGHCEYFATATVLLLRAAHIPARYATGYSVQERSGRHYLVRERHAHAWCLAWIHGAWRDVDTTPSSWGAAEASRASLWEPVRDIFSRLWFEFSRWRWGHADWKRYLLWLLVPLLALVGGRVLLQRQWNRTSSARGLRKSPACWPGLDSEFYQIEQRLSAEGLGRNPGETGFAWLQRVGSRGGETPNELAMLLSRHYQLRFNPRGISAVERQQLRAEAKTWMSRSNVSESRQR